MFSEAAPFPRTVCGCSSCKQCCKEQPGSLVPGQVEDIAAYLGQTVEAVKALFWSSEGALLMDSRSGRQFRQRTITPRYDRRRKQCVFLDDQERCTIHPVAPAGCALFDTHMSATDGQPRSVWMVQRQAEPAYQALRQTLSVADYYKPRSY